MAFVPVNRAAGYSPYQGPRFTPGYGRAPGTSTGRHSGARRVIVIPRACSRRGMGDMTFQQQVQTAQNIASSGAAATAAILVQIGAVGGPVGAIIGAAAAALISIGGLIADQFQGCGQTCVISSQDANQVGDVMLQNLRQYTAAPFNPSLQAAALNNFDTAWAALQAACSNPQLGAAGQRCLSDRQRGACTWKASPGGWVADSTASGGYRWTDWGAAGSGSACWNYLVGMRDPIANDPRASSYSASPLSTISAGVTSVGDSLLSAFGVNSSTTINGRPLSDLFLPAALLLGALLFT